MYLDYLLGFWAEFFSKSRILVIYASVGASIKTAQAIVGTVCVGLAGRPAIGHGAGALGVAQGIGVGALASTIAASVSVSGGVGSKGTLSESV